VMLLWKLSSISAPNVRDARIKKCSPSFSN